MELELHEGHFLKYSEIAFENFRKIWTKKLMLIIMRANSVQIIIQNS
jgi:hypothetical protein